MKPSILVIAFCLVALLTDTAIAQSKVDAPQTIRGRSLATMPPDQVRDCLFIAKDISDWTDRANVAKSRGDFETRFAEGLRWYPCMECSIGGQLIVWDNTQHAYTLVDAEDLEGAPLAW